MFSLSLNAISETLCFGLYYGTINADLTHYEDRHIPSNITSACLKRRDLSKLSS